MTERGANRAPVQSQLDTQVSMDAVPVDVQDPAVSPAGHVQPASSIFLSSDVSVDAQPAGRPAVQPSRQLPVQQGNRRPAPLGNSRPISTITSLTERRSKTSQSAKVVPPRSADKDGVESEIYRRDSITSPDSGSFSICSTSSSSTSLDFDIDLAKYKHDMPPEIKIGYYDCLILYCEDDRKDARLFCDHLINDIVLQKHGPVRAVLYDSAELISLTDAKLKHLEMGVARCTHVFVYLTEQFVADKRMDVSSEICLMKAIDDPEKQWSVVPVYTEKPSECRFKIPTILNRLTGINYYRIDSHYQSCVARLIQDTIAIRVEKEKRHRLEQKKWIEEKKRSDADQEMEYKMLALKEERKTEEHKLTKTEEHKLTKEQHLQPPSFTTVYSDIQGHSLINEPASQIDKGVIVAAGIVGLGLLIGCIGHFLINEPASQIDTGVIVAAGIVGLGLVIGCIVVFICYSKRRSRRQAEHPQGAGETLVSPTSDGGVSPTSNAGAPTTLTVPPELFADKRFEEIVTLKRGQATAFEIPYKGSPQPTVTWTYNDTELPDKKRMEVQTIRNMTTVRLSKVIRSDTGDYTLVLANPVGKATLTIKLNVLDKPVAPEDLSVSDITSESCTIHYQPPKDNGGSDIKQYIIEKRDANQRSWNKVGTTAELEFVVPKLLENNQYVFRVFAENDVGMGDAAEITEAIKAKSPFTVPDAPEKPTVSEIFNDAALVAWQPPTKDGGSPVTGYQLERLSDVGSRWIKVNKKPVEDTSLRVEDLSEGSQYQYRVIAENKAGPSKPSAPTEPFTAKDPWEKPSQPGVPEIMGTDKSSVALKWSPPTEDGGAPVSSYNIEYRCRGSFTWIRANSIPCQEPKFSVTGLTEGDEYEFRVGAENKAGVGPMSEITKPVKVEDQIVATLPAEILRMDDQSIELYKKALSEGETSVHSIRVMVVGHYGVGKTTLTRRLLEEDVDIDARDSTDGIDVHVRRCRVSLDDQSWTVFKKGENVDTTYKKLAEVLSKQSSSIPSSRKLKTVDDTQTKSGEKVRTFKKLPEDVSKQSSSEAITEPVRSEGRKKERKVDDSVVSIPSQHEDTTELKTVDDTQTKGDVREEIDNGKEAVESDMNENAHFLGPKIIFLINDLISNVGTSDNEDSADLSLWDFAGQSIFYSTHQMFLSSRAIYLLVTDISKHIHDVVGDDECCFDSKGAERYKISEFVNYWLDSIHGYCPSDTDNVPPIILVATHADKLDQATKEEQENKYFEAVRNIFDGRVTAMHVVDKEFSINNAIIDANLTALKQKIFEVATLQDYWGEMIPANWLTLERALGQLRDKGLKMITRSKVMAVNNSMPVPIASDEYLDLFLRFHHESANILYFNDAHLRDNILLDPQWLVHCLKSLITAKMFCSRRPQIAKQWKELSRDGILRPNLIDAVWKQEGNQSFREHRGYLVSLMEKLNIIAPSDGDDSGRYHLVPCMLKDPPIPVCIKSDCVTTPVLCITTADGFLPAGVFQCLLAACIAKWNISKQGNKNLIYCGYGCFDLNASASHRVTLYFRDCVIQMWVSSYSEKDPHPLADVCAQVREYVVQALQRINTRLNLMQLSNLKLSIKCRSKDLEELDGQFSVEELLTHHTDNDEIVCHAHAERSHTMVCSELLLHWCGTDLSSIHDNHHHSVLSPYTLETVPSDKQLNQIASKIGKEYERLGLELGLPQVEIEQIKIDNPHHVVTRTVHILLSWRRKYASKATFRRLEQAMESVQIDAAEALAGMNGGSPATQRQTSHYSGDSNEEKESAPLPPVEKGVVRFSYAAKNEDELTLEEGQQITVLDKDLEDGGWWKGEIGGKIGVFPDNFVELVKEEPKPPPPTAAPALKQAPKLPDKAPVANQKPEIKEEKPVNQAPSIPTKKPVHASHPPPPIGKKPHKPAESPKPADTSHTTTTTEEEKHKPPGGVQPSQNQPINVFGGINVSDGSIQSPRQSSSIPVLTMDVPGTMPTASGRTEQSSSAARPCDDVSVQSPSDKEPCDITAIQVLADGRVLLADCSNHAVKLLSGDGRLVSKLSLQSRPYDMALVRGDEAVVTMPGKKELVIISITDSLTRHRTIKTDIACTGIAVSGDKVITGSWSTGEIVMRDMDGRRIRTIWTTPSGRTWCVNINPDNDRLYVTDHTHTVTCVTLAGDVLGQYKVGNLRGDQGMAIHPDGTIYVCGYVSNNIHHITAECTAISVILGNGEVEDPWTVAIDSRAGKLYVSERHLHANKLKVFKLID